jgi:hypothetical protein
VSLTSTIRMIKSGRMRWTEHVANMREKNTCRVWVGQPDRNRAPGIPRHR